METTQKVQRLEDELAQCEAVLKTRRVKPVAVTKSNTRFRKFQKTYRDDPLAFAYDCIILPDGWYYAPHQEEIIGEMITRKRQALYGPRGCRKTSTASVLTWWSVLTVDDTKNPTTASAWRQLEEFLWPEIHKFHKFLNWDRIGRGPLIRDRELKTLSIDITESQTAFAVASNDPNKIEGVHANERVFIIIDESKAVKDDVFDALEGSFSQPCEHVLALAMSTPGPKMGRFYDICTNKENRYSDWTVRPVTLEEAITSDCVSPTWAEARRKQWGEGSALYRNHVKGEFAQDSERVIIPLHFVEQANQRWEERYQAQALGAVNTIGVDPARGGGDKTVIAMGNSDAILAFRVIDTDDTMEVVEAVEEVIAQHPLAQIVTDVIGIGAGVFDRLRQLGHKVLAFNSAEKSLATDRSGTRNFKNKRAEVWWKMGEALNPLYNSIVALPPDDELTGELTTPVYKEDNMGRIVVQSKEELRDELGRSTDKADGAISVIVGANACEQCETEVMGFNDIDPEEVEAALKEYQYA
jgi:hypothetical protein